MSWITGADLMESIVKAMVEAGVPPRNRKNAYLPLIVEWERRGCDSLDSVVGADVAFDAALGELHPERWGFPENPEDDDDYDGPACFRGDPPTIEPESGRAKTGATSIDGCPGVFVRGDAAFDWSLTAFEASRCVEASGQEWLALRLKNMGDILREATGD